MRSLIQRLVSVVPLCAITVASICLAQGTAPLSPPTGGTAPPAPPYMGPRPELGAAPTVPQFRPDQPPILYGDMGDRQVKQKFRKTPDPGEILFVPSGKNEPIATLDTAGDINPAAPALFQDFSGMGANGWNPADPDIGVGGGYVCQVTNDDYTVYDKCGNVLFTRDANDLFGRDTTYFYFDPKIVYDPWNSKWVMLWHLKNSTLTSYGKLVVVVSRSSNPIGIGTDGWYFYEFEMVQDAGTANESFPDYYDLGYSNTMLYAGGDQFTNTSFRWSRMVIWDKAEVYNALTAFRRDHFNFNNPDGTPMRLPRAVKQQSAYSGTAIFVNSRRTGGDKLTKWVISDPFGANTRVGTDITVADYQVPPDAIQPSGGTLDTIDCRLMTATIVNDNRNGTGTMLSTGLNESHLWTGDTVARSVARLFHINFGTNAVLLDRNFGAVGFYYWFPSVAADYQDTAFWVFTRCGPGAGQFAEARYVGWEEGAFVNSSTQLEAGTGSYTGFRWGDYFGASLDWDDYNNNTNSKSRIWMNAMRAIAGGWDTHIGATSTFTQGNLVVAAGGLTAEGSRGGPFSPTNEVFTLTNNGETGLRYTVTDGASWLTSNVAASELYNPDTDLVTVSLAASANNLAVGVYNANITFADCANGGNSIQRPAQLTVRPANNFCSDAITIPSGTTAGSTTLATGTDVSSCTSSDTLDVWYRWTSPCAGVAQADTCGSSYDTSLTIYSNNCSLVTELACNDDYNETGCLPTNRASRVTWNVGAGRIYLIRVSGFSGLSGNFNLFVSTTADFNRDGIIDFFDYLDFVSAFSSNSPTADFNSDSVIDFFDYLDFVAAFSDNC